MTNPNLLELLPSDLAELLPEAELDESQDVFRFVNGAVTVPVKVKSRQQLTHMKNRHTKLVLGHLAALRYLETADIVIPPKPIFTTRVGTIEWGVPVENGEITYDLIIATRRGLYVKGFGDNFRLIETRMQDGKIFGAVFAADKHTQELRGWELADGTFVTENPEVT